MDKDYIGLSKDKVYIIKIKKGSLSMYQLDELDERLNCLFGTKAILVEVENMNDIIVQEQTKPPQTKKEK